MISTKVLFELAKLDTELNILITKQSEDPLSITEEDKLGIESIEKYLASIIDIHSTMKQKLIRLQYSHHGYFRKQNKNINKWIR